MESIQNDNDIVMTGAVNSTFIPVKRLLPENEGEPTFIIIPEGTDKITVYKARAVVSPSGTLSKQFINKVELHYERPIELFGEEFVISQEGNEALIFHRTWPLSGQGIGIEEAMSDLKETLRDLKHHYAHTSIDQLDGRAIILRDFILNSLNL